MADMHEIQELAPELKIYINGTALSFEAMGDVVSVSVQEEIDAASMFTIRMINWDNENNKIIWADDDLFSEGNEIEIEMGYVDNLQKLIDAEITGLEPEYAVSEVPMLTVRGYDRRHRLSRGRYTRSFTQVKDSDIASSIASEVGLSAEVEDTGVTLEYILQHNQTDMEFLTDRARRIGYEVFVVDRTLHYRSRQHSAGETITLTYVDDLLEFYPCMSTMGQVDRITVRSWNSKNKEVMVGEASAGAESSTMGGSTTGPKSSQSAFKESPMSIVDRPVFSQAEADKMALGRFEEFALAYITGEGICLGRTDLRAGMVLQLDGLGQRFSGLYYVASVIHRYTPTQGYRTAFNVKRNAT